MNIETSSISWRRTLTSPSKGLSVGHLLTLKDREHRLYSLFLEDDKNLHFIQKNLRIIKFGGF